MNVTLSREQMRLQKAKDYKLRNDAHVARQKAWLASHPEIAESKEREKQAEAEKRRALWIENEEKRKQLSADTKKKMPANTFAALLGDDEDSTDDEPEVILTLSPEKNTKKPAPEAATSEKKSWMQMMEEDE